MEERLSYLALTHIHYLAKVNRDVYVIVDYFQRGVQKLTVVVQQHHRKLNERTCRLIICLTVCNKLLFTNAFQVNKTLEYLIGVYQWFSSTIQV